MSTATIGRSAALTLGGVAVNGITSIDMSLAQDLADSTSMDDDGAKTAIVASKQTTIDVTANYVDAGAVETMLDNVFGSQTSVAVVCTPVAAGNTYSFSAYVSNVSVSMPEGDKIELSFTLESTGAVTRS